MTHNELSRRIGERGTISIGGLSIQIVVVDAKFAYGRVRYQVEPIAGSGSVWVEFVKFPQNEEM